jgi:hypothetical protein
MTVLSAVYYLFFVPADTLEERAEIEPMVDGSLETTGAKD